MPYPYSDAPSAQQNPFLDPAFVEIERYFKQQSATTPTLSDPYTPLSPLDASCPFPIQSFSDVPRREVNWLWKNRLARGKLHLWAGHPGLGKTAAACDVAARLSQGVPWPDHTEPDQRPESVRQPGTGKQTKAAKQTGSDLKTGKAGRVLIIAGEDGPDDTLKLRLESSGADCSRVHLMDCRALRHHRGININFAGTIQDLDVDLIIFDALAPFLERPLEALCRRDILVLAELARTAQEQNVAIVAIGNLGKSGHVAAACRAMSALAHLAPPRLIFGFLGDPNDDRHSRVLVLPIKANICRKPDPLAFRVHEHGLDWEQGPEIAVFEDLLTWKPGKPADKLELAKSLILSALADGPLDPGQLESRIVAQGISTRTYYRAKAQLPNLPTANCQTAK